MSRGTFQTKRRSRPCAKKEKLVKLWVEEERPNGRYNYWEVKITEKLANELYDAGTIYWNITNEMFGCDRENFKSEWEAK